MNVKIRYPRKSISDAESIELHELNGNENLHRRFRRIIFNMTISNTHYHLRNYEFILREKRWVLSPSYDLNPSTENNGLTLNIDM